MTRTTLKGVVEIEHLNVQPSIISIETCTKHDLLENIFGWETCSIDNPTECLLLNQGADPHGSWH